MNISNLTEFGLITDQSSFALPPNAFTKATNVSFEAGGVKKVGSNVEVMSKSDSRVYEFIVDEGIVYFITDNGLFRHNGIGYYPISGVSLNPSLKFNFTKLSGVIVLSSGGNIPTYIDKSTGNLTPLPSWSENWQTSKILHFKNVLVALGTIENGTEYNQRVKWSDITPPNQPPAEWVGSEKNNAGFVDLSEAQGAIIDALILNDALYIYTEREVFRMTYTGGQEVFSFNKVLNDVSLLSLGAFCNIQQGHFVVTTNDVIIHDGSVYKSVATNKIKDYLFSSMADNDINKVRVVSCPANDEVWICYSQAQSDNLDEAAVYNVKNQTWSIRDLPEVSCIIYDKIPSNRSEIIDHVNTIIDTDMNVIDGVGVDFVKSSVFAVSQTGSWYAIGEGSNGEGLTSVTTLEKINIDFDEIGLRTHQIKQVKAIYPQVDGSGRLAITIGVSDSPYGPIDWQQRKAFDIETDKKVDFRASGRYISVRFESISNYPFSLMSYTIDVEPRGGKR